MKIYDFFRSSSSHRLRIALNLKGLRYEQIAMNLRKEEHLDESYGKLNPQHFVPTLVDGDHVLVQTPAIIEWLEEQHPDPPFLPCELLDRAHVRALAAIVACDIHPLNNRRILERMRREFAASEAQVNAWCDTWIRAGFAAYDTMVRRSPRQGRYSFGDAPTLADVYLVPQIESARRFGVDMRPWPRLSDIDAACRDIEAFQRAAPQAQPDAA